MKYLIDKALSPKTVRFLRTKGFDATRVDELIHLSHIKDQEIFSYAITHDYVIITADLDFGAILAYTRSKKPSTIILRLEDPRVENVNAILSNSLPLLGSVLQKGSIVVLTERGPRIRLLPI